MPLEYTASARLENGKLKVRNRWMLKEVLSSWRDCDVTITIEKKHATRSLDANRWYWSQIVGLVSEHTGHTPEEVHQIYKAKFLPKRLAMANANGELCGEFTIGGSTTKLNRIEFSEYCDAIRTWCEVELGVIIPDPDKEWQATEKANAGS